MICPPCYGVGVRLSWFWLLLFCRHWVVAAACSLAVSCKRCGCGAVRVQQECCLWVPPGLLSIAQLTQLVVPWVLVPFLSSLLFAPARSGNDMIGTAPALSACFATTLLLLVLVGTPCQGMGSWSVSVSISHLVWRSGDGGREQLGWSV